ncbi:MAG: hypothetical protein AAGD38_08860 [Acidobacteriota bacterium]
MSSDPRLAELRALLVSQRPYLILAPPRSGSTALARALLGHAEIGPYIHEPWDRYAHKGGGVESILERLGEHRDRTGILIKEMTFQLGDGPVGRVLLETARPPFVVLIRDPRRTLESRIRRVLRDLVREDRLNADDRARVDTAIEASDFSTLDDVLTPEVFPERFTGWADLDKQIASCRQELDFVVVRAETFRADPRSVLEPLCQRWELEVEPGMLDWGSSSSIDVGALPEQAAWYRQVLASTRVRPEDAPIRSREAFPVRFREPLDHAVVLYENLSKEAIGGA